LGLSTLLSQQTELTTTLAAIAQDCDAQDGEHSAEEHAEGALLTAGVNRHVRLGSWRILGAVSCGPLHNHARASV